MPCIVYTVYGLVPSPFMKLKYELGGKFAFWLFFSVRDRTVRSYSVSVIVSVGGVIDTIWSPHHWHSFWKTRHIWPLDKQAFLFLLSPFFTRDPAWWPLEMTTRGRRDFIDSPVPLTFYFQFIPLWVILSLSFSLFLFPSLYPVHLHLRPTQRKDAVWLFLSLSLCV